MFEIILCW